MSSRTAGALAALTLSLAFGLGLWFCALDGEHGLRRLVPVLLMIVLWGWAEIAQGPSDERRLRLLRWHRVVFGAVGLVLALKMMVRIALALDLMGAGSVPLAQRGFGALVGALLAVWGNYLPKLISPWTLREQPFDWQGVHRFVGWIATLTGLGIVLVWTTLSIDTARTVSVALMLTFAILAVARKLLSVAFHPGPRPPVES